jgi:hypothetical protein
METNHQRVGAKSNPELGEEFREAVRKYFAAKDVQLERGFKALCGNLPRTFSLGSENPPLLVQSKSLTWTSGKIGSAKMKTLDLLMLNFSLCPSRYTRILFMESHVHEGASIAREYVRLRGRSIADGIQVWELDTKTRRAEQVK